MTLPSIGRSDESIQIYGQASGRIYMPMRSGLSMQHSTKKDPRPSSKQWHALESARQTIHPHVPKRITLKRQGLCGDETVWSDHHSRPVNTYKKCLLYHHLNHVRSISTYNYESRTPPQSCCSRKSSYHLGQRRGF